MITLSTDSTLPRHKPKVYVENSSSKCLKPTHNVIRPLITVSRYVYWNWELYVYVSLTMPWKLADGWGPWQKKQKVAGGSRWFRRQEQHFHPRIYGNVHILDDGAIVCADLALIQQRQSVSNERYVEEIIRERTLQVFKNKCRAFDVTSLEK